MENLTKRQKHQIYIELLEKVCADPFLKIGMCYYSPVHLSFLPELYKHKPVDLWVKKGYKSIGYYAPCNKKGWEKRIAWIEQAIEDTK